MKVRVVARSETGPRRDENQDRWLVQRTVGSAALGPLEIPIGDEPLLFAVADGMGGYEGGAVASHQLLVALADVFFKPASPTTLPERLVSSVRTAQRKLQGALRRRGYPRAGTTLAGLAIGPRAAGDRLACVFHVGDSRVVRVAGGTAQPLTIDHTPLGEWIRHHGEAEVPETLYASTGVLRAVGPWGEERPELRTVTWEVGDLFLLCTDGLHGAHGGLPSAQLATLDPARDLDRQADALVARALAVDGTDNATAVLMTVVEGA